MSNFNEKCNPDKSEYFPSRLLGQSNHDDGQWHNNDGCDGSLLRQLHQCDPCDGADDHEEWLQWQQQASTCGNALAALELTSDGEEVSENCKSSAHICNGAIT